MTHLSYDRFQTGFESLTAILGIHEIENKQNVFDVILLGFTGEKDVIEVEDLKCYTICNESLNDFKGLSIFI